LYYQLKIEKHNYTLTASEYDTVKIFIMMGGLKQCVPHNMLLFFHS